jgi:hypothetical protein
VDGPAERAERRRVATAVSVCRRVEAPQRADGWTPLDRPLTAIEADVQRMVVPDDIKRFAHDEGYNSAVEADPRRRLDAWLQGSRVATIKPLRCSLEFNEVMRRGGFDAVVVTRLSSADSA